MTRKCQAGPGISSRLIQSLEDCGCYAYTSSHPQLRRSSLRNFNDDSVGCRPEVCDGCHCGIGVQTKQSLVQTGHGWHGEKLQRERHEHWIEQHHSFSGECAGRGFPRGCREPALDSGPGAESVVSSQFRTADGWSCRWDSRIHQLSQHFGAVPVECSWNGCCRQCA